MEIKFKNCNNIDEGKIDIKEGKLNIKYGVNGTGKSTISKALKLFVENKDDLFELQPYKYIGEEVRPIVTCDGNIKEVMIYNQEYIDKFLFEESDNVMVNGYEVLVKPQKYDQLSKNIDNKLYKISNILSSNEYLNSLRDFVDKLSKYILLSQSEKTKNTLLAKSKINKLFDNGNVLKNVPDNLNEFTEYIKSSESKKWTDWHNKGAKFVKQNKCPYCSKEITNEQQEIINQIDKLFEASTLEAYSEIANIVETHQQIFSSEIYENIKSIVGSNKIEEVDKKRIVDIYLESSEIVNKIYSIRFSYVNLKNVNDIESLLNNIKINVNEIKYVDGEEIIKTFVLYNEKIEQTLEDVIELKRDIGMLKTAISRNVNNNIESINYFLKIAGINYEVVPNDDLEKIYLTPLVKKMEINVKKHLSYGEINSFALALFVFEVKNKNDCLIILDDPISSYDTNKKSAIMSYLFLDEKCLKNKNVLLLTHDLEPIISLYMVNYIGGLPDFVSGTYLENVKGTLIENEIKVEDLKSIIEMTKENMLDKNLHIINRLIHFRKYIEYTNSKSITYDFISSILKGNYEPKFIDGTELDEQQKICAINDINKMLDIQNFNYKEVAKEINNIREMINLYKNSKNNHEKIEIFRILKKMTTKELGISVDDKIMKYINEAFHIENSYLFQLNPYKFNAVPSYIIDICDKEIDRLSNTIKV